MRDPRGGRRGCGCPRAREQGGQRSPAARRPGAASARCQTHPPPRGAFHALRRGAVACRARSPPSEAPELLARLWRVRNIQTQASRRACLCPRREAGAQSSGGAAKREKKGKGKGGEGGGKERTEAPSPWRGPPGKPALRQASKRASRCRGLGTRRDARIHTLADTEETSTWGPWRPVTPRDGSRAGSRPLPRHPAGSPREQAARPSSRFQGLRDEGQRGHWSAPSALFSVLWRREKMPF